MPSGCYKRIKKYKCKKCLDKRVLYKQRFSSYNHTNGKEYKKDIGYYELCKCQKKATQ